SKPLEYGFLMLRRGTASFFFVSLLSLVCFETGVRAEDQYTPGTELPSLPGPNEVDRPYYLTAKNVALFHDALIAPLATWLKEGRFVTRGMQSLDQTWDVSAEWIQRSKENASRVLLTQGNNIALPGSSLPQGEKSITALPFGNAAD